MHASCENGVSVSVAVECTCAGMWAGSLCLQCGVRHALHGAVREGLPWHDALLGQRGVPGSRECKNQL